MAIDGVFLHYLIEELKSNLTNGRINKIFQPSPLDLVFQIRVNQKATNLFISSELSSPRIYLTNEKSLNPDTPFSFCMILRKYVERGIIENIRQIDNDRIVIFDISAYNELGDATTYHLIFEVMGRNSNVILTSSDYIIIDSIRRLSPGLSELRTILPKAIYQYPPKQGTINPFASEISDAEKTTFLDLLEGCSPLLKRGIKYLDSVDRIIYQTVNPVKIISNNKLVFYVFDLPHVEGERHFYPTISSLLETIFLSIRKESNPDSVVLTKLIKRELNHQTTKLSYLKSDLQEALKRIEKKPEALLLQANLYKIKTGDTTITVDDFYNDGEQTTIKLDPKKSPSENLQSLFNTIKKSEKAIKHIEREINKTIFEINYSEGLLVQLSNATGNELLEIKEELQSEGYLHGKKTIKRPKKALVSYEVDGGIIMVGKNNIQNNTLTNQWAKSNDFWFHVKDAPSAHVILRTSNITEPQIRACAMLAALHSKFHASSSVPVDYTLIKYVKKIPGQKGSFVTYSNQKTIFIDPDEDILKTFLRSSL